MIMMNKKSKKVKKTKDCSTTSKSPTDSPSNSSFAPFTTIRKSFKRLKRKKEQHQRVLSADSVFEHNDGVEDNISKTAIANKPKGSNQDSNQNILKRIASGKRFRIKNNHNSRNVSSTTDIHKFDVVEWSSCESLNENFEKRMRKHNSLRRSKASLLMPSSGKQGKISPPSTKITRYSSLNNILDSKTKPEVKWNSNQNVSSADKENCGIIRLSPPKDEINGEKRKRPRQKANSASLPNICEEKLKPISIEIEIETDDVDTSKNKDKILRAWLSSSDIKSEKIDVLLGMNRKRCSLIVLDDSEEKKKIFGSTPFLDRPPIPSDPKPTLRRDQVLRRCVSTEGLSPKKRRSEMEGYQRRTHKRALSDCHFIAQMPAEMKTSAIEIKNTSDKDLNNGASSIDKEQEEEVKDCLSPPATPTAKSLLSSASAINFTEEKNFKTCDIFSSIQNIPSFFNQNEEIWMKTISDQLPLAIAEALWDHTGLNEDDLAFSSGDVISVLYMEDEASWWWGVRKDGKEGWFPASYVRLRVVQEIDDELTEQVQKEESNTDTNEKSSSQHTPTRSRSTRGNTFLTAMGLQTRSSSLTQHHHKNMEHLMAVRAKCVEELVNTEKDYVQMLRNIIEGYLEKVRQEKSLFTAADAETIFGNIEELYHFHKEFLKELQQAIKFDRMEESIVGHLFIKHKNRFEIYSKYCNNQPRSSARISRLIKEKKYELFFETCRLRQNMIRLSLDGFLLSPVQRICKYPLQLKELLKHTHSEHEDYNTLNEAKTCMQNVAAVINERKRRLENVNKLARWQLTVSNWKDEDVVMKSSDLLFKGPLLKINNGRECERFVYLFDHQLLYFVKEENRRQPLCYRGRVDLDTAIIENLGDNHVFIRGDTVSNVWRIWNTSKTKWCYFRADTAEKKENWLKALENEREHVKEEQKQGFTVLPEVRSAAMESAYTKHIAGVKRGRMRRKSICTNHPELETTYASGPLAGPINRTFSSTLATSSSSSSTRSSNNSKSSLSTSPSSPTNNNNNNNMTSSYSIQSEDGPTVRKRVHKPKRKNSFRWSLNSTIFEKYF